MLLSPWERLGEGAKHSDRVAQTGAHASRLHLYRKSLVAIASGTLALQSGSPY